MTVVGDSALLHLGACLRQGSLTTRRCIWGLGAIQPRSLRALVTAAHCQALGTWGFRESFPLAAQMVKNLPEMRETCVQSPGQEDPLEKGMATDSSILAWRIPWTEEPSGLQSMGSTVHGVTRVGHE